MKTNKILFAAVAIVALLGGMFIVTADESDAAIYHVQQGSSVSVITGLNSVLQSNEFVGVSYTTIPNWDPFQISFAPNGKSANLSIPLNTALGNYIIQFGLYDANSMMLVQTLLQHTIEISAPAPGSWIVTYDANGGVSSATVQTVTQGSYFVVYSTTPVWVSGDYIFTGWLVHGTSTILQPGQQYQPSSDIILVAQWDPALNNIFRINYNAPGASNIPADNEVTTNNTSHAFTITSDEPTLDGYTFTGWETYYTGTPIILIGGETLVLFDSAPQAQLYATWIDNGGGTDPDILFLSPLEYLGYSGDEFNITFEVLPSGVIINVGSIPDWLTFSNGTLIGTHPEVTEPLTQSFPVYLTLGLHSEEIEITIVTKHEKALTPLEWLKENLYLVLLILVVLALVVAYAILRNTKVML